MLKNKKKIIFIIVAILLAVIIMFGTVFALRSLSNKDAVKTPAVSTETSADNTKTDAIKALENNDDAAAKVLFEEAQAKYEALGDKDNTVDTEAQLYLLEHSGTTTE